MTDSAGIVITFSMEGGCFKTHRVSFFFDKIGSHFACRIAPSAAYPKLFCQGTTLEIESDSASIATQF